MYQNKYYWWITLSVLILFFLGLAGTSIGHIITYWGISNDWIYPQILASENAIGIISSILLTFHNSSKLRNLGILIFLATFFVELAGNIYYYYITIKPASTAFQQLAALTQPIFDSNNLILNYNSGLRSWTALIQGFWLPFTHVCVFAAIAIMIEKKYKGENDLTEEKGSDEKEETVDLKNEDSDKKEGIEEIKNEGDDTLQKEEDDKNASEIVNNLKEGEEIAKDEDEGLKDFLKSNSKKEDKFTPPKQTKKDSYLAKTWTVKK